MAEAFDEERSRFRRFGLVEAVDLPGFLRGLGAQSGLQVDAEPLAEVADRGQVGNEVELSADGLKVSTCKQTLVFELQILPISRFLPIFCDFAVFAVFDDFAFFADFGDFAVFADFRLFRGFCSSFYFGST
jgi:hypothetical protein